MAGWAHKARLDMTMARATARRGPDNRIAATRTSLHKPLGVLIESVCAALLVAF
jgi:hypothetical protein